MAAKRYKPRNWQFAGLLNIHINNREWSAAHLAGKLGLTPGTVSRWLNNETIPDAETVNKVATVLELSDGDRKALLDAAEYKETSKFGAKNQAVDRETATPALPLSTIESSLSFLLKLPNQMSDLTAMLSGIKHDITRIKREKGKVDAGARPDLHEALAALEALPTDSIPLIGNLSSGSRIPHSTSNLFVGRETELKQLAFALKGGGTIAIGQIAAATGLGGIGKTQLAVEFVHRYGQFFSGGVYWLSFADPNGIAAEVAACGVNMPEIRADFDTFKLEEQVQFVLSVWESPLPRLLIFDNCEDPTLLEQWRPKTGGSRVLITSRRQQWDALFNIQPLILGILTPSQSIELLRKFRPDLAENNPILEGIADELGHLPLALHLAGHYLKTYKYEVTPEEYLAQLRLPALLQHSSLQQGDLSPTGHEQHVARTFAISYERLQLTDAIDSLALDLLARGAWFAPGQLIPRRILLACVELSSDENKLQFTDAVQRLVDLGLVASNDDGHVLIHRLIASFVQHADSEKSHIARHSVASTVLKEANQINNSLLGKPLLTWQNHLRFITETVDDQNDETIADLYNALGTHLYLVGAYAESATYLERSLAIYTLIYGENHSVTAASHCHLGGAFHLASNLQAAKAHLELSLSIRKTVCGEKHPYTAESYGNLASLLQTMGNFSDAKLYYERAIDVYEVTFGKENLNTVSMYSGLADLLQIIGDYVGAKHYLEQTLVVYEEKWGKEHPETARIYNSLGMLLKKTGDFTEARAHLTKAMQIAEKVLGTDHPQTANTYNSLGMLLMTTGDYKEAKSYLIQSLKIKESALDIDHLDLISGYSNLGMVLLSEGDMSEAKHYLEQAFALAETVLDDEHITMASIYNNLGHLYSHLFNLENAKSYYELSLHIKEKTLGKDHPDIADSYNNLGMLLRKLDDPAGAKDYLESALAINIVTLGDEHPRTISIKSNIGLILAEMGDLESAKRQLEQIKLIQEQIWGQENEEIALNYLNLGTLLHKMEDFHQAQLYLERATAIYERVLGKEHHDTARSYHRLGLFLKTSNDLKGARMYLESAVAIHEKAQFRDHPDAAEAYYNLGVLQFESGEMTSAKSPLETAREIFEKVFGKDSLKVAPVYCMLGAIEKASGNLKESRRNNLNRKGSVKLEEWKRKG